MSAATPLIQSLFVLSRKTTADRRRYQRIHFDRPIVGLFGSIEVEIVDLSLMGARIEHLAPLSRGKSGTLKLKFLGQDISIPAEVSRCTLQTPTSAEVGNVYTSGLNFPDLANEGVRKLRELVSEQVRLAMQEQIRNARGEYVPEAERMTIFRSGDRLTVKPGAGNKPAIIPREDNFVSCAFQSNKWKKVKTRSAAQPNDGFTVLGSEDPTHVDLLCQTYENSDETTRKMIRMLAEISLRDVS